MKAWSRGWVLGMTGRQLLPLLLFALALLGIGLRYQGQMAKIDADVERLETLRLRERLSIEQARIDVRLGQADPLRLRRLVGALGLHDGLDRAYLTGPGAAVLASLSRGDLGRPVSQVAQDTPGQAWMVPLFTRPAPSAITVERVAGQPLLTGLVPLIDGHRLGVRVDIGHALALRRASVQREVAREALAALLVTAALALLLHLLWFRRARQLAQALKAMGEGDLTVRTGLRGRDELGLIGKAADRMAEQLQTDRARALHMGELVNRSPLVVIEWRNAPGWPVSYVSQSVAQWGYTTADFLDGQLQFSQLLHPDDAPRIHDEVAGYIAHGPDEYRQVYRLRCADGRWAWVEDRTSLTRDGQGEVLSISGILLDTTAQKAAEQAQHEQAELLRMFYELPFLGMAISSPTDKRWLQVNDRLCEILGHSREELLRMTWAEMTPPGDLERNVALFDELLAGQRAGYQMSKRFVRKDGRLVHTEIDVRAVRDADGRVKRLFATIQDVTERKQAEAALLSSAQQLREAQRIGRMGSWAFDLDAGEVVWSEEVYRIHETDSDHFKPSYESFLTTIHPDDRERVSATYQASIEQGTVYETAYRICLPGDRLKHLRVKGETEWHGGRPVRTVGMVLDVTDITLAQQALQEKESMLAEAQDIACLGNWSVDLRTQKVVWSDAMFRLLGYDPTKDEPGEALFLNRIHPGDLQRVLSQMRRHAEGEPGELRVMEHRIVTPAGLRHVELHARLACDVDGQPLRLYGTTMDVTERREATSALQDYKEMLEQAEALVKLGSWAGEVGTQRLTVSAQLFRNVGLDPSGRTPTDAEYLARIHPDDRAMVVDDMQRIRNAEEVGDLLFRTDPAWGPMRWLRRTVRRVTREAEGRGPRYIGTLLDVTDTMQAEERLRQLNLELEQRVAERTNQLSQANQELEAFSYTVSHDLKAPLRGIDGYSQLLVDDYGDRLDADGREFVQRIRQGVQQMGALIIDLLEYSRMERRGMAQEPVALRPLVEQILEGYHADIQTQGVQVNLCVEPLTLALDREGISVVLRNLIGNALKFSRDSQPPTLEIGARSVPGRRILWVRDNGVGFDMKYHDRMFGIFQRLHRAEEFPGTGVGLALVAKAVQRMGGRVRGESSPGAGATFYLEFPE
ncbi:MAG: PAS domain-containing protein [Hydrogenophaga sp.]|uniref:PAS domain-containing protein n=1 Tax=Hydrogenophaga sp. TaxID=1904254 RepID=UPI0025B8627C|nr:PAS domain-containing protein [Hydrogenophaga sp.]MBT9549762.1 PAS domain-containing protein [Hydrogenophaga sp.]